MSKNNIKVLLDNSLANIRGNKIEINHPTTFQQVSYVKSLKLHDDQLKQVPTTTFKSFQRRDDLINGENKFAVMSDGAFRNTWKVD